MTESPNIKLTLTPSADTAKTFRTFRNELCGDEDSSNMMKIDAAIGKINGNIYGSFTWGVLKNGFSQAQEDGA